MMDIDASIDHMHACLREIAEHVYLELGICINSVRFDWSQSHAINGKLLVSPGVEVESRTLPGWKTGS